MTIYRFHFIVIVLLSLNNHIWGQKKFSDFIKIDQRDFIKLGEGAKLLSPKEDTIRLYTSLNIQTTSYYFSYILIILA